VFKKKNRSGVLSSVVVSFPKSGRTWLRVMLDELKIQAEYEHDNSSHNAGLHLRDLSRDKSSYAGRNVVLLIRDPRDVTVSGFHQTTRRTNKFSGSLSEFIRDEHHGIAKVVAFYQSWALNMDTPRKLLLLRYEELRKNPSLYLERVAAHFELPLSNSHALKKVVETYQFDNMQAMERSGGLRLRYGGKLTPRDPADLSTYKVRKGIVGSYMQEMSAADVRYCDEIMQAMQCPWYPSAPKFNSPDD
jgi:hypothetical protein